MGRTHSETVEQEWAYINLAALSTREMGPGARHTALDDNWGGWNWRKILGFGKHDNSSNYLVGCLQHLILGSLLETNLTKALEMASIQRKVADDFSNTFPKEVIQQWEQMVMKWNENSLQPNPYVSSEHCMFFLKHLDALSYNHLISFESFQGSVAADSRRSVWGRTRSGYTAQSFSNCFRPDGS